MLSLQDLEIDLKKTRAAIETFIRAEVRSAKASGAILGISGGIDSFTTAKLCSSSLGSRKVLGLILPVTDENTDTADAVELAEELGIAYEVIKISSALDALRGSCRHFNSRKRLPMANLTPRIRMTILYYHANLLNYLVIGTGNKSEILAGYFTKYGDGGADALPIGDLYKTQVRMLAEYIGAPEHILRKIPSAGLWKGQADEKEIGITYPELDLILYAHIERGLTEREIHRETRLTIRKIAMVMKRLRNSRHKREMPPVAKTTTTL